MMASDEYCPAAVGNLRKSRKIWAHMSIILGRDVANPRVPRMFLKTLIHVLLISGAETWVMNPCVVQALGDSNTG